MWMHISEGASRGAGEDGGREVERFGVVSQLSVHRPCCQHSHFTNVSTTWVFLSQFTPKTLTLFLLCLVIELS